MLAMNRVQPPAKTPKDFYVKFLTVRAENCTAWHVANDVGFFQPSPLILLLNRRDRREVMSLERRTIFLSLLMLRSVGLVALKVTLDLSVPRVHILIENVPFLQNAIGKRWAFQFPGRPHCDSTRSLDGPKNTPNPTAGLTYLL
jgi:hypothetical protein